MAACADSCMTSPSFPVRVRRLLPSIKVASVASTEPPTSVQARPVVRPISLCFSSQNSRNFRTPRKSLTLMGVISEKTFVCEREIFVGQAGGLARAANEEALGDFELFLLGVAGEAQDFHAVLH